VVARSAGADRPRRRGRRDEHRHGPAADLATIVARGDVLPRGRVRRCPDPLRGLSALIGPVIALFTAAAWTSARTALACLAAILAAHGMAALYEASAVARSGFAVFAVSSVFVLLDVSAWALGRRTAAARAHARELTSSRDAMAEEAIALERMRIARGLRDVVAHAVTVMVLQSSAARLSLDREPRAGEGGIG
jgi:signal transduction histidine kinase